VAFAVDVAHSKPRGIPKAAWFMALGVAVFGIMGGIAISRRQTPQRPMIVETSQTPGSIETQPDPHSGAAPGSPESPRESTEPDMVFAEGENGSSDRERRRHSSSSSQQAPTTPEASAAARQAALERMIGGRVGSVPVLPATPLRTPSAPSTNNAAAGGNEQTSARTSSNVPREREAADRLERSGVVRRCWEQFKLRNPAATPRRIEISVRVNEAGAFTLRASGTGDESLSSCIQSRPVNALGPGAAASTTVHVTLN
jgi:hypothetical protein